MRMHKNAFLEMATALGACHTHTHIHTNTHEHTYLPLAMQ